MRLLADCIDQVFVTRAHSDCLRLEREQPAALSMMDMVNPEATEVIRAMLSAFASGNAEEWLERMAPLVESTNARVVPQYFTHEKNLNWTKTIHSLVSADCSPALQKALRRGTDERFVRRITTYATSHLLAQLAPRFNYTTTRMDAEFESPSYMARTLWLRVFYTYDWIGHGGIEQLAAEKNSNDEIDRHYVIVASYADSFMTCDSKARRAERALRAALAEWELFSKQEAHWFQ
jgi:hypothetical protein